MPHGSLTRRQKLFAEYLHQGESKHGAYHKAGYTPNRWLPYVYFKNPKVQAHIRKLEERAMKKHDITVEKILTDLESAKELAMTGGQPSAAVNAIMSQAKIVGLVVDKVERKDVNEMDKTELAASVREVFGEDGEKIIKALDLAEEKPLPEPEWKDFPATGTVQ